MFWMPTFPEVTDVPLKCLTNGIIFPYMLSVPSHELHRHNIYAATKYCIQQVNRYSYSNKTNKAL